MSRTHDTPGSGGPDGDRRVALAVVAGALLALSCWLAGGVATFLAGRGWPALPARDAVAVLAGVLAHPSDPSVAWHAGSGSAGPPVGGFYAAIAGIGGAAALLLAAVRRRGRRPRRGARGPTANPQAAGARWGAAHELAPLLVRGAEPGRIVIGRVGRRLAAAEAGQSILVAGPTQCGKTSGLVVPAILEWDGPVLATSVKTDLVRATLARRAALGRVDVFDPAGVSGAEGSTWSPLRRAGSWAGARRVAGGLCGVARAGMGGGEDAGFWYLTAEKLLAPLLFAAASSGATMADVVRWVDTGEVAEVLLALELAGVPEAVDAATASFSREERQRSSVYTTVETVLAAYADPDLAAGSRPELDPSRLFDGGRGTCYLVAPAHEQERLQPLFVALVREVVEEAMTRSSRSGRPLERPLLVVLDEAANVAPLAGLDALAATASSHGVQLLTVWQDLAQIETRYGGRAATVVNNHRAKVLCAGIADPATLEQASRLIGEEERRFDSSTVDRAGGWSRTSTSGYRRLAPTEQLRCLDAREAVVVYGNLPPFAVELRPYYSSRELLVDQRREQRSRRGGPERRREDEPPGAVREAPEREDRRDRVAEIREPPGLDPATDRSPLAHREERAEPEREVAGAERAREEADRRS